MPPAGAVRAGRAFVELTATDDQLKKGLEAAYEKLKRFSERVKSTGDNVEKEVQKRIGAAIGYDRYDTDLFRTGIALVGIRQVGQALNKAATEAAKMRAELIAGEASASELVDRIASTVPVFGQVWQAGRAIREILTGQKSEIDGINQEAKLTLDIFNAQVNRAKLLSDILKRNREEAAARAGLAERMGITDEYEADLAAARAAAADRDRADKEQARQQRQSIAQAVSGELAARRAAVENSRRQFESRFNISPNDAAEGGIRMTIGRMVMPGKTGDIQRQAQQILEEERAILSAGVRLAKMQEEIDAGLQQKTIANRKLEDAEIAAAMRKRRQNELASIARSDAEQAQRAREAAAAGMDASGLGVEGATIGGMQTWERVASASAQLMDLKKLGSSAWGTFSAAAAVASGGIGSDKNVASEDTAKAQLNVLREIRDSVEDSGPTFT